MTTDVKDEVPPLEIQMPKPDEHLVELRRLLEFKKAKIQNENETPCPACTTLVTITANECPHCESDIAANNALIRESMRRLGEITAEIDSQHATHVSNHQSPAKGRLLERIKRMFSDPADVPEISVPGGIDDTTPRILNDVWEGDLLRVVEWHGDWCRIKTRDGKTGWVYSTFAKDL